MLDSVNTRKFTESTKQYFSHTPCGADAIVPGSRTWTFQYAAPSTNEGTLTFYISSLASNHNHNLSGDYTYALTKTLDFTTAIQAVDAEFLFQVFPNPAQDELVLSLNEDCNNAVITIDDLKGEHYGTISVLPHLKKVLIHRSDWNLNEGIYLIKIQSGEHFITKKIIFL